MITFGDLLKNTNPSAIDQMQSVANQSFADKYAKNPYPLEGKQLEALNQEPEILENILNKWKASKNGTVPEQPSIPVEEPVASKMPIQEPPVAPTAPMNVNPSEEAPPIPKPMTGDNVSLKAGLGMSAPLIAAAVAQKIAIPGSMQEGKTLSENNIDEMGRTSLPKSEVFGRLPASPSDEETPDSIPPPTTPTDNVPSTTLPKGQGPFNLPGAYQVYGNPPEKSPEESEIPEDPENPRSPNGMNMSIGQTIETKTHPLQKMLDGYRNLASTQGTGLSDAQDAANKNTMYANLLKAVDKANSGITGLGSHGTVAPAKIDNPVLDNLVKDADRPIENYKQTVDDQKNNPSSKYSQTMREFLAPRLKQMGLNVDDEDFKNVPGSVLEKIDPMLSRELIAQQRGDYLKTINSIKFGDKDKKAAQHESEVNTRRLDQVNKAITGGLASSRSGFGKDYNNLAAVQNVRALLEGSNLDDIDNRQIAETARVMDRILSQGNPTISGTEHLTPETARMKIAKYLEYATNKRQGAGASSFLKNTLHTLDREESVAKQRAQTTTKQALASYRDLADKMPEAWDAMIMEHDPHLMDLIGSKALKQKKDSPKEEQETSSTKQSKPTDAIDIVTAENGKKYEVDHNTKKVLREVQ